MLLWLILAANTFYHNPFANVMGACAPPKQP